MKSARDIAGIWRSGQITAILHTELSHRLAAGVSTLELEEFARSFISKHGAIPTFLGYQVGSRAYPAALCVSINEEIVHGIPSQRRIKPGDFVSIDLGVTLDGYISDAARTWYIGDNSSVCQPPQGSSTERLFNGTLRSLDAGIAAMRDGVHLREISRAIEAVLVESEVGIVRELSGHGVGFQLHEEPTLFNYDTGRLGPMLQNGLVIAIEPMATLGSTEILLSSDEWTYCTADGSLAAHFEHTVVLWDGSAFVLTDQHDENARQAFGAIQ